MNSIWVGLCRRETKKLWISACCAGKIDLCDGVIVTSSAKTIHAKAADMLRDEVEKRTRIGLDVWIWYPVMEFDVDDGEITPALMELALKNRDEVLSKLPRVDAVFVPSGDPDEVHPRYLFPHMKGLKRILNRYHPKATIWSLIQNYDDEDNTPGREPINPRPRAYAKIFRNLQQYSIGFISYSEGCNDDVNKIIWSCLGWDPDMKVEDILRQYSRYFISARYEQKFARGLLGLEKNWEGPLLTNESVFETLSLFQEMEKDATPQDKLNWRFQQRRKS